MLVVTHVKRSFREIAVACVFEPRSSLTKDDKIDIAAQSDKTGYLGVSENIDWLGIMIMCPSGETYLLLH